MRRIGGLLGLAIVVLGLATSAAALAEETYKLLPGAGVTYTAKSGATQFVSKNGLEVKCTSSTSAGEMGSFNSGAFKRVDKTCTGPLAVTCTGLADAAGEITLQGELDYLSLGGAGNPGLVYLLSSNSHFTCGGILSIVRGCVAGPVEPADLSSSTAANILHQLKGINEFTSFLKVESKEQVSCALETSTAGGKFEQSGERATQEFSFSKEVELMAGIEKTQLLPLALVKYTTSVGANKFVSQNGLEVKCTSIVGEGEIAGTNDGSSKGTLKTCTGPLGVKCTGLANSEGEISFATGMKYTTILNAKKELSAGWVQMLNPEIHFSCGGILSLVRGCLVGPITPLNSKTTTASDVLVQSKGVNEITHYLPPISSEEVVCKLETSTAGGKFEQSGEEATQELTFSSEVELMN